MPVIGVGKESRSSMGEVQGPRKGDLRLHVLCIFVLYYCVLIDLNAHAVIDRISYFIRF